MSEAMQDAIYLYGFVPPDTALPAAGLLGVEDALVELLDCGGFRAAFSRVPAQEYNAEAIHGRVEDLGWVAERGVRHEQVVAWFVDHAQILPARLLTLYSSTAALSQAAQAGAAAIREQLERFRGLREWDLKVSHSAERVAEHASELSPEIARLDAQIAAAPPGKRYLLEKKRAGALKSEVARTAREAARELLDGVRPLAREHAALPLPPASAELPVLLHAALLVSREDEARIQEEIRARTERLETLGMSVSFSGPWAPYRFLGANDDGGPRTARAGGTTHTGGAR